MTDLDSLDFHHPDEPAPTLSGAVGRKRCRRHDWVRQFVGTGYDAQVTACFNCGAVKDEARSRLGKSNARLGKDQERRAEKRYGWEKIGERGQMTDLRGTMFKVQQKSSRRKPPALFRSVFPALDATRDGRIPAILLSYVHQGKGTEDFVVVRGSDWLDLHGRDEPA